MKFLLAGGAGYIGSHVAVELLNAGHEVVIADNLSNSSMSVVDRITMITGKPVEFCKVDLTNEKLTNTLFDKYSFDGVMHFAGYKAVGESVENPLAYYTNNLSTTTVILKSMLKHKVNKIVFSSSATVYGTPTSLPLTENSQIGIGITNPYGWTKYMNEQILRDTSVANPQLEVTILRYFNPIGAHSSGLIGENPSGVPQNLMPYLAQIAVGKRDHITIYGNDWNTHDGTGVRDYIHVTDLALGHVAAIQSSKAGTEVYNLGSGKGTSVLDLINAFSKACKKHLPYDFAPRRAGDIDACYASSKKANDALKWSAIHSVEDACEDTWRWQSQNPNGYGDK